MWKEYNPDLEHWYVSDAHYWFHKTVQIPSSLDKKEVWLEVKTELVKSDEFHNPQLLLFINGEPVQGFDRNHTEIIISKHANAGDNFTIDFQVYTGLQMDEFNFFCFLNEKDPLLNKLYWDLSVPLDAIDSLEDDSRDKYSILNAMNETINMIDFRKPYSKQFYNTAKLASSFIDRALYQDLGGNSDVIASCIGHTHIDVAYRWTVAQTREKVCRSFATVLQLMKEYPSYTFMSSQPQLYEFIKERYPQLYSQIQERIKEGRWEVEGGMWVEADCNIPSGESLVRQFIYGMDFFKTEFNKTNKILWLPDVFGYNAALPQIMKKVGIEYFMTTKLNWNELNKFPHDTFNWIGIDGTKILTYLITTRDPGQDKSSFYTTYNGILQSDVLIESWKRYQEKEINNDILIAFGYGDGGGGANRQMLEVSNRLEKGIKGIPKVRQITSRNYFDQLDKKVKADKRLASWKGELYFEFHRGTYTSMARNKRSNRKIEISLMDAELLSVMSENYINYPKKELDKIWKLTLRNQFHDILPGTAIKEVYDVTKEEYKKLNYDISKIISDRIKSLNSCDDGLTLFNTTGFQRNQIIELPKISANSIIDNEMNIYPIQNEGSISIIDVKDLPSKGYKSFSLSKKTVQDMSDNFIITDSGIETHLLKVSFDENKNITSIYDKEARREVIEKGKNANIFRMFEDKPSNYDNWNIDSFYTEKYWDASSFSKTEWIEKGPLRATLLIERNISESTIRQKLHFYYNSKKIDFETFVEYKENQHLLKVLFPTNINTDEATYDIQFGNVKRKTNMNTTWDEAKFETCGHKWVDVSEGHYGCSLLNDCKYGYSVDGGEMALTLIKSGNEPNPEADRENHYFTYSFLPHIESWENGNTVKESYFLNYDVLYSDKRLPTSQFSLASVDKENVIIETIKKSEDGDGHIIRLYECDNSLTYVTLSVNLAFKEAMSCNLIEKEEKLLSIYDNNISFTIKPFEIITIKVK
ncbi:MAG: alpha-mannosidase [Sphaerochaeta sp.]